MRPRRFVSPLKRAKESFLSRAEARSRIVNTVAAPRLNAVGYGSYAGFAGDGSYMGREMPKTKTGEPCGSPVLRFVVIGT